MLPTGLPQGATPGLERPGPLRDRVHEALLELITTRALRPGWHLVEGELAAHLGVSRQPVREALQRLAAEGRVDLLPAQGAFVHEPTREETDQLPPVRTLLGAEAARPPRRTPTVPVSMPSKSCAARGRRRWRPRTPTARTPSTRPPTPRSWSSPGTRFSRNWPRRSAAGPAGAAPRWPGGAAGGRGPNTAS